MKLKTF
jgi:hypothetical protein